VDVQERVARLEGRVEGHAQMLTDIAAAVRHLEVRMDQRFTVLEGRLTALDQKLDRKIEALDQKIGGVETRLQQRIGGVETRLEQKLDSHFRWLVGIQFATLVTLVASLVALAG
jgi:chromosome segregation ATPase